MLGGSAGSQPMSTGVHMEPNKLWRFKTIYLTSVPDPDPRGFGPPVSGSISQRYGSRFFYQQSKNSKTVILIVL
jgi:hypothetical protein